MISKSPHDTEAIAREYARKLEPREGKATVIGLSGELGSGKTTFVKAFAAALGLRADDITSPTFVIQKSFLLPAGARFKKLVHIDAYRLEKPEEMLRLGWQELLTEKSNLILIEWPEHIGPAMPSDAQWISFSHDGENSRKIVFN